MSLAKLIRAVSFCLLLVSATGCSGMFVQTPAVQPAPQRSWLAGGTITVARLAPAPQSIAPETMLGFLPGSIPALASPIEHVGTWLSIDKNSRTITLLDGSSELGKFQGEGLDKIQSGTFHLVLKQRSPLWYAPDSYFAARGLPVPPPGDNARFRRGALGDFVIFLNKDTPLYSGPLWTPEIGGVRMEENDLSRIYYRVDVGSPIEVK